MSTVNKQIKARKAASKVPHLIVEARAGTGKTTTLVSSLHVMRGSKPEFPPSAQQKAIYEQVALSNKAKSVAFVAFNKSIATELARRVPSGVSAMTMHSMGLKAVNNSFDLLPGRNRINGWKVRNIIEIIVGKSCRDLMKTEPDLVTATDKLVGLCKANLAEPTPDELDRLCAHYDIETNGSRSAVFELVPQIMERCLDVDQDRYIDFNDMIWLPVALNLSVTKYDVLFGDEVQDWNRCQQELACMAGRRLVLCGDPKQAIYGFAGADSMSMSRMLDRLSDTKQGCVHLPLTTTYRCGKAIVAEANKIVPDFEAYEANPEGEVLSEPMRPSSRPCRECGGVGFIDEDRGADTEGGDVEAAGEYECGFCDGTGQEPVPAYMDSVQDGDMIICRVNAPLVQECFKFLRDGRKANIQGRDIGAGLVSLVKKMKADTVPELLTALEQWYDKQVEKENSKKNFSEARLIALGDKYDCLTYFCEDMDTVEEVIARIERIFTDNGTSGILLSSGHKAKGLEADNVYLLMPDGASCPHPMARSKWQVEQEYNLLYVMCTRAINKLVYVS